MAIPFALTAGHHPWQNAIRITNQGPRRNTCLLAPLYEKTAPSPPILTGFLGARELLGPTQSVWFYKVTPPDGRKHYTKTKPIQYTDFQDALRWWRRRKADAHAWKMTRQELEAVNYNLDQQHPSESEEVGSEPPAIVLRRILDKEAEIHDLMSKLEADLGKPQ